MFKKHTKAISIILTIAMIATMFCTALSVSAAAGETYVVAGDIPGLAASWEPTAAAGSVMDDNGDGTYSLTVADVPAGSYSFKITDGSGWGEAGVNNWGDPETGNNYGVTVTAACDVTITFDSEAKVATVDGEGVGAFELEYISVVGNGDETSTWCNGLAWGDGFEANKMTEIEPGIWSITFYGVEEFDGYQAKFACNGGWAYNWGIDGTFDAQTNPDIEVPELSDVTLTIDVNNFDFATKSGFVDVALDMVPAAEPATTEPETTEPETTVPVEETTVPTTEPETTEPVEETTAPETTAPETTEPETTAPVSDKNAVNGVDVEVGKTVKYTVVITVPEVLENVQGYVTYDSSVLSLKESSDVKTDILTALPVIGPAGTVWNTNLENKVKFNASSLMGYDFTQGGVLVDLTFEVIGEGDTTVATVVEEMNGAEGTCFASDAEVVTEYESAGTVTVIGDEPVITTVPDDTTAPETTEPITTEPEKTDAVINGVTAHVGDKVTYTATLKADEVLENIQGVVNYTGSVLKLIESSDVKTDILTALPVIGPAGTVWNTNLENKVKFNASSLMGYDFTQGDVLVKLTFDVVAVGDATIETVIEEMNSANGTCYASDSEVVTPYELSGDVAVECTHPTEPEVPTTTPEVPTTTPEVPTTVPSTPGEVPTDPQTTAPAEDVTTTPAEDDTTTAPADDATPEEAPTTTPNANGGESDGNGTVQTGSVAAATSILLVLVAAAGAMYIIRRRVQG